MHLPQPLYGSISYGRWTRSPKLAGGRAVVGGGTKKWSRSFDLARLSGLGIPEPVWKAGIVANHCLRTEASAVPEMLIALHDLLFTRAVVVLMIRVRGG